MGCGKKLHVPAVRPETQPKAKAIHVPAESTKSNKITISANVFGKIGNGIVCTADGNGMSGAGICDGNYVIFDTAIEPKSGDIVMAKVDGQLCCRRYFLDGDKGRFRREDGITQDVITTDFTIFGVMIGLMRKVERAG